MQQKSGVAEWADHSYNVGVGCSHNCAYCYARGCAMRFKRVKTRHDWSKESLKQSLPRVRLFGGRVMFPSSHDITPFYLPVVLQQLKALLALGNHVLVVSKPGLECISKLCSELAQFKGQLVFRFTISSLDRKLAKFWEPGAPTPSERVACLQHAWKCGYTTSVSMEPLLAGTEDAVHTFYRLIPFVRETIWIGRMNHLNRWGFADPGIASACRYIRVLQCDSAMLELVRRLGHHPQVRWKDSIRKVIESQHPAHA